MKKLMLFISCAVLGASASKPNFVFIYVDDMGWTGTSVEMIEGNPATRSDFYQTPNIETLAQQGMRFSNAYASAALCTPSRAAVLTGKTPAELHMTTPGGGRPQDDQKLSAPRHIKDLPPSETTIAEYLKTADYSTAHLGKWHLGNSNPGDLGFDVHDGATGNDSGGSESNPKDIFGITERAISFMTDQVEAGKPFYVQLSHYAVHAPVEALDESIDTFEQLPAGTRHNKSNYAAMTWDFDASIGLVQQAIDKLGIADNTYLVFMSDNGAGGNPRNPQNYPLNAGKGSLYEGGIRVPLIVKGPGIEPNTLSNESVTGCDLFPTFCEWAELPTPEQVDGTSMVALLKNHPATFSRKEKVLLFHYPHYGKGPAQKPQSAIIFENYKLLRNYETDSYQLFDLEKDIGEQNDLSAAMPGKLAEMKTLMIERLTAVNAQLPTPNPDYDPAAVSSGSRRASRKRN